LQIEEKVIHPMGLLPSFGHHPLVASQQVGALTIKEW